MPSANTVRMSRRRCTAPLAVLAVLVAASLSACGSSTTVVTDKSAAGSGTGSTASSSTAATTTTATATSVSTSTTTTTAGPPACTAATLKLAYLGGQGATGHGELGFELTNSGSQPCHTYGYPGVQFQSASGAPLPTKSTRTTTDFFGTVPEQRLTVAPGSSVSFRLGVTHGAGSSAGCTTAAQVQVIPPDDTHPLVVTIPGGAYECGTTTVSPLQQGTTAFH
jgi:Protein of unknown function (DUF4232)